MRLKYQCFLAPSSIIPSNAWYIFKYPYSPSSFPSVEVFNGIVQFKVILRKN